MENLRCIKQSTRTYKYGGRGGGHIPPLQYADQGRFGSEIVLVIIWIGWDFGHNQENPVTICCDFKLAATFLSQIGITIYRCLDLPYGMAVTTMLVWDHCDSNQVKCWECGKNTTGCDGSDSFFLSVFLALKIKTALMTLHVPQKLEVAFLLPEQHGDL